MSLKMIDREVGDITRFLVTHAHRDHYTRAVAIRREVGSTSSWVSVTSRPSIWCKIRPWR